MSNVATAVAELTFSLPVCDVSALHSRRPLPLTLLSRMPQRRQCHIHVRRNDPTAGGEEQRPDLAVSAASECNHGIAMRFLAVLNEVMLFCRRRTYCVYYTGSPEVKSQ
jgi:hypothetical protein